MASDPRRFDAITKVVSDQRRQLDDIASTVLSRVSSHTHSTAPNGLTVTGNETVNGTLAVTGATTVANVSVGSGSAITRDSAWQTFTFSNSWTDNTFARYRMMPDGTVMFRGIITKSTNPTNGEIIITGLPAAYRPSQRANFLCPCSSRAYNGSQKIEVETDGTVKIWDMATATGDVCLDPIRYAVI